MSTCSTTRQPPSLARRDAWSLMCIVDARNPNRYALFELYADEAAVDEHRFSKQLAKHRAEVDPAILTRVIWVVSGQVDESNFRGTE